MQISTKPGSQHVRRLGRDQKLEDIGLIHDSVIHKVTGIIKMSPRILSFEQKLEDLSVQAKANTRALLNWRVRSP